MKKVRRLQSTAQNTVGQKFGDFRATIDSLIDAIEELQKQINKPINAINKKSKTSFIIEDKEELKVLYVILNKLNNNKLSDRQCEHLNVFLDRIAFTLDG